MLTKHLLRSFCPLVLACSLSACGNQTVKTVREGTLDLDEAVSVGDALGRYKYFDQVSWTEGQDDQHRTIVEFKGRLNFNRFANAVVPDLGTITPEMVAKFKQDYDGMVMTYVAQFPINKNGKDFQVSYSGLTISGTAKKNGAKLDHETPDNDLTELKWIYRNLPEPSTTDMMFQEQ